MALRHAIFSLTAAGVVTLGGLVAPVLLTPAQAATPNPAPYAGARKSATRLSFGVSGTTSASLDVGSGNVLLSDQLLTAPGVTAGVPVAIAWNSSVVGSSVPSALTGRAGSGWGITGFDQRLVANSDSSVTYYGPSGLTGVFTLKSGSTTSYTAPSQFQADLTKSGTGWTLKQHKAGSTLTFNSDGRLTKVADRNSNTTTFNYDPYGYPDSIVGSRGPTVSRTVDISVSGGRVVKLTQKSGDTTPITRSVSLTYSDKGNLASVTDTGGGKTTFASDAAGYTDTAQVAYITNPAGASTTITYSGTKATQVSQTNDAGSGTGTTRLSYASSTQTLVADPTTSQSQAVSAVAHTTYNLNGNKLVADTTDPNGNKRSATYTSLGDVATSTPAAGGSTTFSYGANAGESLTSAASDAGAKSTAQFTGTGSSQYSPSSTTDDSGNGLKYSYNGAGNKLSTTQGAATVPAKVSYNDDGTASTSAAPGAGSGVATKYTYDANHQLTKITPVSGSSLGVRDYTWDGFGRLATATDGNGHKITYSYDNADRITKVDYSDATSNDVSYSYDSLGRTTKRVSGTGTTTYGYDDLGHLVATTNSAFGGKISYGYDKSGALTSETDARGTTTYAYDSAHQLTSMTYPAPKSGAGATQIIYFHNDENGRRTDAWLHSNTDHSVWNAHNKTTYDSSGRVTHVVSQRGPATDPSTAVDLTYCYAAGTTPSGGCTSTPSGDRAKIQWSKDAVTGESTTYTYDGNGSGGTQTGRLTSVAISGGSNPRTYKYTYDAAGNRLTSALTGKSTQTETFNSGNQLTTSGYTYDAAGNLTRDGANGNTYTYNTAGQRISATTTTSTGSTSSSRALADPSIHPKRFAAGTEQVTTTYTYGGTNSNELLKQTTPGGDSYRYAYGRLDQSGLPQIEEITKTGSDGTNSNAYVAHDPSGTPVLLQTSTGTNSLYVYDGTGNPVSLTTDFNAAAYAYSFDPYGAATVTQNSGGTGLPQNPYVYGGGLQDRVTGLIKFGKRWYDPTTGRWIQQDALNAPLDPKNADRYSYAGGDPVNASDPAGTFSFDIGGSICAFGGCLNASIGVDDDGDVQASGGVGVGAGGSVDASIDPDGDYTSGEGDVTESVGCNVGPVNESVSTSDGETVDSNTTIGTSEGVGCSASVTGSYTF